VRLLTSLALVIVLVLTLVPAQESAPVEAQAALPALPAGWPTTLQLGMGDGPGGAATMRQTAPFGFRYQYLSGGVNHNPERGWATWNANGDFARFYIQDSIANGITPVFTYYMMRQSGPNDGQNDGTADFNNLQNQQTMTRYFNDLKLFYQRAADFPSTRVVLHVEPDLWGFMQQRSTGDNAATVPAQVASTGLSELGGLPNNLAGFAQGIRRLRDTYARNVVLAYHVSVWGTGNDILYSDPDNQTVSNLATRAGNFFNSLNSGFDVAFAEFGDRDAAFKQFQYGDAHAWWQPGDFARNQLFISRFVTVAQKRVVFWQIPVGNTRMRAENNTWQHYQDNKVEWLLEDSSRANLNGYLQAGVIAFLFGRGADGPTCFCDAARDGVTNPAPINGNTRTSLNADDDGGFFREQSARYYSSGAMQLPNTGGSPPTNTPVATNTPTRTATPVASSTPTRTPTPAPNATNPPTPVPSGATQTITFNDLSGLNRALGGQYPTGVVDWGSNAWYLSGPFGGFSSNSVSFNGAGPTSASLTLLGSRQLVSLDAHNGGSGASTISLNCTGRTPVSVSVSARQTMTIATNWSGTCATIQIGSSNGWNTNFDNFVIGSAASATATPVATATSTRTPTPTVGGGGSTGVSFDDLGNPNRVLNGQYPSGVIDWGTTVWYLSGPFGAFRTNSVSFNGAGPTSASLRILNGRRLSSVDAYNGGSGASTLTLACAGQPTLTVSLNAGQSTTLRPAWSAPCASITVGSSNGWNTNFDNFSLQ
jgi:hypothetical protein